MIESRRATGHLRIEERKGRRVWVATVRFGASVRTRRVVSPAWAKAKPRATARGGSAWRAVRLLLDKLPHQQPASESHNYTRTLGDAVDEWLRHREVEKRLKPTTMRYYRHLSESYVLPELARGKSKQPVSKDNIEQLRVKGRDLQLHKITSEDIDRMGRSLLERGLAPRTVAKAMVATRACSSRTSAVRCGHGDADATDRDAS